MFKPTNIISPDDLFIQCQEIQAFIEAHYNADNPAACVDRGTTLESYMAQSSKMLADAKYHHNGLIQSSVMQALKEAENRMTASTLNKYIDSLAKDYQYLVDWCDRINKTCTHQIDFCRTLISKHKEEARLAGWGNNRA